MCLAILGSLITFIPGAERNWFLVVAGLSIPGFFISKRSFRIAAMLLFLLALGCAYSGHRRGIEYHERTSSRIGSP